MRAVIIAGGFGTRMRPLSLSRPKPLIPVANRPLLEYQVGILRKAGISEIVFATNYLAEQIVEHFGDGSRFGISMSYRVEPEPMDTAGAIRYAVDGMPPKRCIVFNGDTLHDFDLSAILDYHDSVQAEVTLTLYRVNRPHPFGVVPLNAKGQVEAFIEPTKEQKLAAERGDKSEGSDLINAGLYIIEPEIVERIPLRKCSIEREFYPGLLKSGGSVFGYECGGYWIDIGRPSQLLKATKALLTKELKLTALISGECQDKRWIGIDAQIADSARIDQGCHIGVGCVIGENVVVTGQTTIGIGCRIGAGSILDGCILMERDTVGENCRLTRCVIDQNCRIEDYVKATEVVLGAEGIIGPWSSLGDSIL